VNRRSRHHRVACLRPELVKHNNAALGEALALADGFSLLSAFRSIRSLHLPSMKRGNCTRRLRGCGHERKKRIHQHRLPRLDGRRDKARAARGYRRFARTNGRASRAAQSGPVCNMRGRGSGAFSTAAAAQGRAATAILPQAHDGVIGSAGFARAAPDRVNPDKRKYICRHRR